MNEVVVLPLEKGWPHRLKYDALIAAVGYEQRARFIAGRLQSQACALAACAFDNRKALSYDENLRWFLQAGFEVKEVNDAQFESWCRSSIAQVVNSDRGICRLAVDISSMSRFRIATLLAELFKLRTSRDVEVHFLYAPAQYSEPSYEEGPIVTSGPVTDFFAGWSTSPERPILAIFGLGTEQDKALGAMEFLEPRDVWAFEPTGVAREYDRDVKTANEQLLKGLDSANIIRYRVGQPHSCFSALESVTFGALDYARPVLVPFGPKIFALASLLTACLHYPAVTVWRVSSDQFSDPVDRVPNGQITGLRTLFRLPKEDSRATQTRNTVGSLKHPS